MLDFFKRFGIAVIGILAAYGVQAVGLFTVFRDAQDFAAFVLISAGVAATCVTLLRKAKVKFDDYMRRQ